MADIAIHSRQVDTYPLIEQEIQELKENPDAPNYMIRVQQVIGKILAQFTRIAEKERVNKDEQKATYKLSNREWATLQREVGNRGFNFTLLAVGLMAGGLFLPKPDQELAFYFSKEGCSNLANMFNSETQGRQRQFDTVGQLSYSELNAMMNKSSSADSSKQEFINLLDRVFEALKRAAQSN